MKAIEISAIKLRRVGVENEPGRAVVSILVGMTWFDILEEQMEANFCSSINVEAIAKSIGYQSCPGCGRAVGNCAGSGQACVNR